MYFRVVDIQDGVFMLACGQPTIEAARTTSQWASPSTLKTVDGLEVVAYKRLAPDKNGFLLCEGDTVIGCWCDGVNRVATFINGHFIVEDPDTPSTMSWEKPSRIAFVSRPTGYPGEKEKEALQQKVAELEVKVAELKAQAERM
jgi:hypothetical protein